jgi:branched-chain amino acid transport system substrate-binding protein
VQLYWRRHRLLIRRKTCTTLISLLILPLLTFAGPKGFYAAAQAVNSVTPTASGSKSITACTGKYKFAFEYSNDKSNNAEAQLAWKRGTRTALSAIANSILEWKRGTPTVVSMMNAAQLSVKKFLEAHPAANIDSNLLVIDDHFDTATAVAAANDVVNDGCVLALIGPTSSHIASAVIPIYSAAGIPMLSPSAIDPLLKNISGGTFHRMVLPEDPNDLRSILTLNKMGVNKPAVIEDDFYEPSLLSKWANAPNLLPYSLIEWKRGTPTVTALPVIAQGLISKGADGFLYNGNDVESNITSQHFASEFKIACPSCGRPLFYGENSEALFDVRFDPKNYDGVTFLADAMPMQFANSLLASEFFSLYRKSPMKYSSESYDAASFLLAGFLAGNTSRSNLNTFVNTHTYNGLSGTIAFTSDGERWKLGQNIFKAASGSLVMSSSSPLYGYIANGEIGSFSPTAGSTTAVAIQVKEYTDSSTVAFVDVLNNAFNRRITTTSNGTLTLALYDGTTYVTVTSTDKNEIGMRSARYQVIITSGVVTSIKNSVTNSSVPVSGGVYTLKLATPTFIGKVTGNGSFKGDYIYLCHYISGDPSNPNFGSCDTYIEGHLNETNTVLVTTVPTYGYSLNLWIGNSGENWQFCGDSEAEVLASSINSLPTIVSIAPRSSQITGQVSGTFGTGSKAYLERFYGSYWRTYNSRLISTDGHFGFAVYEGGTYRVRAVSLVNGIAKSFAVSSIFSLANENGTKTDISITLPAVDLSGQVTLEGTPQAVTKFVVYRKSNGNIQSVLTGTTDNSGNFSLGLPSDTYTIHFNKPPTGDFGSTDVDCVVISGQSKTCNVVLTPPSLAGTISGITGLTSGRVFLYQEYKPGYWFMGKYGYGTPLTSANKYSLFTDPGTYRLAFQLTINSKQYWILGSKCAVTVGVKSTCNTVFSDSKFNFSVKNLDGTSFTGKFNLAISLASPTEHLQGNTDSIVLAGGDSIQMPLVNGDYELLVNPVIDSVTGGISRKFSFTSTNGIISNLKPVDTTTAITATGGIYPLTLGKPQIAGRVLQADGATPAARVRILYGTPGVSENTGPITDSNGYFIFDTGQLLPDQTLNVWGLGLFDKSNSSIIVGTGVESATISNGSGPLNLVLRVKNPNARGVVSGPNGISKQNFVQVLRIVNGGQQWTGSQVRTDGNGAFGFYLAPGTYQFRAQDDLNVGGMATTSAACVISGDTPTVCNISLTPPNVSGTVSLNGKSAWINNISLIRIDDGSLNESQLNAGNSDGTTYAGVVTPGSYKMQANIFVSDSSGYFMFMQTFAQDCIVPATGKVSCNITLPSPNLKFKVSSQSGDSLPNGYLAQIQVATSKYGFVGTSNINSIYLTKGKCGITCPLEDALLDGSYRLIVQPLNGSTTDGVAQNYLFDMTNGVIANMRVEGTTNTISSVDGVYNLRLRSPALSGRVVSPDGSSGIAFITVQATLGNQIYYAQTDSNGNFGFNLGTTVTDGTYVVKALVDQMDNLRADSLETSTVINGGLGPNNLSLRLREPNFTGTVIGPLGVSANNWVTIRKLNQNGGWEYVSNGYRSTTSQGKFGFFLDPGNYQVQASSDLDNAGGTTTVSATCAVVIGQNTVCNVSLLTPNVIGFITRNGSAVQGAIEFYAPSQLEKAGGQHVYVSGTGSNQRGYFGINLASGTYTMNAYLWNTNQRVIGTDCVVPETGTVTCNFSITNTNLRVKIASAAGAVQVQGTSICVMALKFSNQNYCMSPNANDTSRAENNGEIALGLPDGEYRAIIFPGDNQKLGKTQRYRITVESATVTSLKLEGSSNSLSATSGVYTLTLASPSIAGNVVAPDGSTPVPNSLVSVFDPQKQCGYCDLANNFTDQSGYFGFDSLVDGQYQVLAHSPYGDSTKADSLPQSVTVTGGNSSGSIVLALQNPNVTGVVRGPNGVSVRNWIEARKLVNEATCSNCWESPVRQVVTDAQGNFAFNLAPGRYRFSAQADLRSAGGIATVSDVCVVPVSGSVACNITLLTSNFKFKIVDSSNLVQQGAYGWIYYADKSPTSVRNYNPQISYTSGGTGEVFLEDGTWNLQLQPAYNDSLNSATYAMVTVSGGTVTSVKNSSGEPINVSAGYYNLALPGVNLKGRITFAGDTFTVSSFVYVKRLEGSNYQYLEGRWIYNGIYGFKEAPGTYQIEVRPGSTSDNGPVTTRISNCVVGVSGVATCDVPLKSANIKGKITNELGDVYRYAYATLTKGNDKSYSSESIDVSNGLFKLNLDDGTYQVVVTPYWEYQATYTSRSYEVTVVSGVVTTVKDLWSMETTSAIAGIYSFKLGTPSVRGKVLEPLASTVGVPNINIQVARSGQGEQWIYGTNTDASGNFALTIPDGSYVIRAIPNGKGYQYGKSETQTITIVGGAIASQITLRLRAPNLTGRVVTPGASPTPLANVNVNLWIDGEYFYTWTDSDGRFGAYVDKSSPNCPTNCTLDLNYYQSTDYTYKRYSISGIGSIGDKAIGGVTSRVTVLLPQSGSATTPNKYSFVSVESVDTVTGTTRWVSGGNTDELGKVGLNLDEGVKYKLTFYPNWESIGLFPPKVVTVDTFTVALFGTMTVTFDRPNLKLTVASNSGIANSYGWYQVNKLNSTSGNYEFYSNNYLDYQGKGATVLPDGTFKIHFWPGKTSGVETEISVTVSSGIASGSQVSAGVATVVLPTGNISGYVRNQSAVALKEVIVSAVRADDPTKIISTVTDVNGYYELNLDRSYAWSIKALEPSSATFASISLPIASPSNAVLTNRNLSITVP